MDTGGAMDRYEFFHRDDKGKRTRAFTAVCKLASDERATEEAEKHVTWLQRQGYSHGSVCAERVEEGKQVEVCTIPVSPK
jgi:hypothetical protein